MGKHQSNLLRFAIAIREALERLDGLIVSVSLAASSQTESARAELAKHIEAFSQGIGWHPNHVIHVAGALKYSKYGFFKKLLLRSIARKQGLSTDTSRDHEYTDWNALDQAISDWAARFQA